MNVMKKAGLSIAACGVAAVMVGTLTASGSMSKSAGGVKSPDPVTVEQTDAAGVSLTSEPQTARAGEVGVQEVTAQLEPSNAICDLEWTLSVGDSEIPEADMSEYLTIEETSAISIELVCHKRYDGFAELHVEDLLTGKTATASVTAWNYNISAGQYFSNSDFSENTTGQTSFSLEVPYPPGQALGKGPIRNDLVNDWFMYSSIDYAGGYVTATYDGALHVTLDPPTRFPNYTVGIVQEIPTYQAGPNLYYTHLTPGSEWYLFVETEEEDSGKVELSATSISDEYGQPADGNFYVIRDEQWTRDGLTVFKFHVGDYSSYSGGVIGVGFTQMSADYTPPGETYTVTIKSISLYQGA